MNLSERIGKVPTTALAVSAVAVAGGLIGGLIMKKVTAAANSVDKLPEKWGKVGKIKDLLIYPVKGMPGISVNEAVLGRLGLKGINNSSFRDRAFAIVDVNGKCYSQTKYPMLALARPSLIGDKLYLSYDKDPSLDIVIDIPTQIGDQSEERVVILYGERVKGLDCGDEVSEWLNKVTGTHGLRLVYHVAEEPQRGSVKRNSRFHTYRESHTGAFQDETSYMIMTDESVEALNKELEKPVSHKNFRPTIVINEIPEPFAEDFWGYISFGDSGSGPVMKSSLPCQRCNMTTVDPETGTFRSDGEPLKSLYRLKRPVGDARITKLVAKAAIMGSHFGVFEGEGDIIRVGDTVHAALL